MKRFRLISIVSAICLLFPAVAAGCAQTPEQPYAPPEQPSNADEQDPDEYDSTPYARVAVIGCDGAGTFFRDAQTPNIDAIFENGAVTYECLTANPSMSAENWGSLLHGVTPHRHGLSNGIIENGAYKYPKDSPFPSIFRVIREEDSGADLAAFCSWNPINTGIIENNLGVQKHNTGGNDKTLTDEVCNYLQTNDPKFLFVQYNKSDDTGHAEGYGSATHLNAINELDGYIKLIYDAYDARGFLDDTLFIVTADHGGTYNYSGSTGGGHGGLSDKEKYVMFAARGKNVENGTISDMTIRDTAAVVIHALGLTAPEGWTGRVPDGLFRGVKAPLRHIYTTGNRAHTPEATPEKTDERHISNFIDIENADKPLIKYLPFDGDITDVCGGKTLQNGKLTYAEGYYGQSVVLENGYVSIPDFGIGKDSFSVAFWIQRDGSLSNNDDPGIISNKHWDSGYNSGFILSYLTRGSLYTMKFNVGNGSGGRFDKEYSSIPADNSDGWMHVIFVVDRKNNAVRISFDFGNFISATISDTFKNASFDGYDVLNIGQDGTGLHQTLYAAMDEFMMFRGALTQSDVDALARYYGAVETA